jgi:AraC-like DNA-binding protein
MKIFLNPGLLNDSSILKPVPPHLQPSIFKWAQTVFYFEDTWGYLLIQEYVSGEVRLYSRKAVLNEEYTFYVAAEKPSVIFQFQLEGAVDIYFSPMQTVELIEQEFGFLYFSKQAVAVTAGPGIIDALHFEIDENWIGEMAKANEDMEALKESLINETAHLIQHKRYPLDDTSYFWINRILNCTEEGYNLTLELKISLLRMIKIYHNLSQEDLWPEDIKQRAVYPALLKIWKAIKVHPNKRWFTLEALALDYHFSGQVLRTNFKEVFNETFSGYLHRSCMQRAFYWLQNTDWPVSRIADELGYDNVRSLVHAIQKWYKKTPEEIRGNRGLG